MTLRPGGEYPLIRRRQHRIRRRTSAQAMQSQRTTQARSGYAEGTFFNPAAPYMLYGNLITPSSSASSGGTPQKAQKAITPQKAA
jgi:hypothetical protein